MIGAGEAAKNAFVPEARREAPAEPVKKIPLEVALNARDAGQFAAANPITAAAAPLLILLGRLRLMIVDMQAVPLMNHVAEAIVEFEKKILAAGVSREDVQIAKYALCGTADDIVQNLPGTDRHVWMQYSMLARFFQVRTSGVGFFEELNKILANPAPRYDLLELMHACLSLGFEGQYRGSAGGDTELQRVRRDVYQTLRHLKARSDDDISPRWRGMSMMMRDLGSRIPIWAIASLAALGLVGVYILLRFVLSNDANLLAERLIALHPGDQITIERAAFQPYVAPESDSTQLDRIRAVLAPEIAAGGMAVEAVGEQIVVMVDNLILFASGKADVKQEFVPVAQRIAEALNPEPGPIHVIGHTDNVKPRASGPFKSNFDLSVARAKSVEAVLAASLSDAGRLVVEGKGEDEPIADNKTAEGRQENRRVLMIRTDSGR
jgi:type VI secretion system protein ImpK